MSKITIVGALAVMAIGTSLGMATHAAEVQAPSSVNESAPAGKKAKGKDGTPTMPSKGPSSVSESAPQKTGKEPPAPMSKGDSRNLPNPKTPSSVSESAPDKAADADKKGKRKRADKEK